jgi:hypothetical protein
MIAVYGCNNSKIIVNERVRNEILQGWQYSGLLYAGDAA